MDIVIKMEKLTQCESKFITLKQRTSPTSNIKKSIRFNINVDYHKMVFIK